MKHIAVLKVFMPFLLVNYAISMEKPRRAPTFQEKILEDRRRDEAYAKQRAEALYDETRKFEFSNQSNQMVAVWMLPKSERCWIPITLTPEKESGIVKPTENKPIYIYTFAGIYMMVVDNKDLKLTKEIPTGPKKSKTEIIRSLPYSEAMDILVTIDPNGSVDFAKRNRQQRDESYFVRH